MTQEEYMASIGKHLDTPVSDFLQHGGEWKKHKYIRIENGLYVYPEDYKADFLKSKAAQLYAKAFHRENTIESQKEWGNREASVARSQASGMRRNAEILEGQANYKRSEAIKNDPNNQATQNARRESDESAKKAQAEGNKMQAQKEYEKNITKYAKDTLNAIINQATKGNNIPGYNDSELDKKLLATGFDEDTINKDFVKRLTESWDQKKQSVDPIARTRIDNILSDLVSAKTGKSLKPSKLGGKLSHSTPMSHDEFYAAVYDYKQKH